MNTPKDCPDEKLHELWDGGPELPTEVPVTYDEKIEKLFADELKPAIALAAALNRMDALSRPTETVPELFFSQRRKMIFDRIPVGHDIGYRCYDGNKHDAESAFTSGEFGDGLSENEAYVDWLRNVDEPEPAPRASRVIHHQTATDPAEYADRRDEDIDFDDGLSDDDR